MENLLNTFLGGFTSWKTTAVAIIGGVLFLLVTFHVVGEVTAHDKEIIIAAALIIGGWFAKDATATGEPLDEPASKKK